MGPLYEGDDTPEEDSELTLKCNQYRSRCVDDHLVETSTKDGKQDYQF